MPPSSEASFLYLRVLIQSTIMRLYYYLIGCALLAGCTSPSDAIFKRLDATRTGVTFVNSIQETETDNVLNYEYFYNGGGVAAADFNNDGLTDLYFTANQGTDKLYLNKGELAFEDITEQAGITWNGEWKTGVTVVDINQDGWQDIYVSVSGNVEKPQLRRNKLYINNKNLTFTEKAAEYHLDLVTFTTQTAFFDYDKDGDLDAYVLNHNVRDFNRFDVEAVRAMRDSLAGDRLMRNDKGIFVDVSAAAGIKGNPIGFGLGVHTADLNGDGWADIYVSNDYIENDYLYINNQDGTFSDRITQATNHVSYFSMGNDVGDINNDLLPDIVTMDMLPEDNKRQKLLFGPDKYEAYLSMLRNGIHPQTMRNMLQLNNGNDANQVPYFSEIGQVAGISNTDWSWSALLADYDNDGFKDLFVTNGYLRDYTNNDFIKYYADQGQQSKASVLEVISKMPSTKTPNYIFRNNQDLTFSKKQQEWGFNENVISNGALYADLDNDGDLEIITNNINEEAFIYENRSDKQTQHTYLSVQIGKLPQGINTYGTKIYLYSDTLVQYREFTPTHGFQSSMMTNIHFGLGTRTKVDSVVLVWPNGMSNTWQNVASNQTLKVNYSEKSLSPRPASQKVAALVGSSEVLVGAHAQMPLNDFSRHLLLPQMYSYQGPRLAKGDVNADGLDDVYVGGGKGQAGQLFLQTPKGQFVKKEQPDFAQDELCTDTDAVLFDADQDGDLDLYVASGGFEYLPNDLLLQNRLYLNDGRGNFKKNFDALEPDNQADCSVEVIDFDRDGDLDLFVAGGIVPQQYPQANPSMLLRNDKGKFSKVAQAAFENLGILNDAVVIDLDRDGYPDIVAAGEWTGVIYLKNNKGVFGQQTIYEPTGLWQRIMAEDFDKDGDTDLVVGNYGLNSQWKASGSEPLSLHYADFDDNGKVDPILSYYIQGLSYPAYSRDELLDQLVPLKKVYTNHELYAVATTSDILKNFANKTPESKQASTLSTVYLVNEKGTFSERKLPIQAQFSPAYALLSADLNGDAFPDLVMGGNQSHGRVRMGNIDASFGQVFINDRRGNFRWVPNHQAGLLLKGDVKDFVVVGKQLIVGINNSPLQTFRINQ
jgi:enediyne biosynthesis protein E4